MCLPTWFPNLWQQSLWKGPAPMGAGITSEKHMHMVPRSRCHVPPFKDKTMTQAVLDRMWPVNVPWVATLPALLTSYQNLC